MKTVLTWITVLIAVSAFAQSGTRPGPVVAKPTELMKCKPAPKNEEVKAREAAEEENLSDHEVLARLIFSETLSTGYFKKVCEAPNEMALMEAIGWGILNRVDKYSPKRDDPKPDAFFHVIFKPGQFRTSFSGKGDNPYAKVFLCPHLSMEYFEKAGLTEQGLTVYGKAKETAARIIDTYQNSGLPTNYSKITHFFFPHSTQGGTTRPAWAKDPDPKKNKGYVNVLNVEKPCAEFYRR